MLPCSALRCNRRSASSLDFMQAVGLALHFLWQFVFERWVVASARGACAEDRGTDAHHGCALFDGLLHIVRHTHGKLFKLLRGLRVIFFKVDRKSTRLNSSHVASSYAV